MAADPCDAVRRWLQAYNSGDDEALVALAHEEIVLRPLRFQGRREYRGIDGIRSWLADIAGTPRPAYAATQVDALADGRVLVEGEIEHGGDAVVALFEVRDGRIAAGQGYLSDRETLQRLGIV